MQGEDITRKSMGEGPIHSSEWVKLSDDQETPYLLIRSDEENFSEESIDEIRQERMGSKSLELPPCSIDIVFAPDKTSQLYVVLPTGLETHLPFICNAPFIQDPARIKIKDPETSPTNRWLLEHAGRLAAKSMLSWLNSKKLSIEEKCEAYELFPNVDREDNSVEGVCGTICEEAFEEVLEEQKFLLSDDGRLLPPQEVIAMPLTLYEIWQLEQLSKFFDTKQRILISKSISSSNLDKLKDWDLVEEIDDIDILDCLSKYHCTKPKTWHKLLILWNYIFEQTNGYYGKHQRPSINMLPVKGKDVLYSSSSIVRLGEKKLLAQQEDWNFLSKYLLFLNQNWLRFLTEHRRQANENNDDLQLELTENAYDLLESIELDESSDVSKVMNFVSSKFFEQEDFQIEDCIRLAHIAAALGASVDGKFQYVTKNGYLTPAKTFIATDIDHKLDIFVNESWYEKHVLDDSYFNEYKSCTKTEWLQWIQSERSKILTFIPLQPCSQSIHGRTAIEKECQAKEVKNYHFPYASNNFSIEDWNFKKSHWDHWTKCSQKDEEFWGKLCQG